MNAPPAPTAKRRPTIRALLAAIFALAIDFALFRGAETHVQYQSAAVWLYMIVIVFLWRYVPAPWDLRAAAFLLLVTLAVILALFAFFSPV